MGRYKTSHTSNLSCPPEHRRVARSQITSGVSHSIEDDADYVPGDVVEDIKQDKKNEIETDIQEVHQDALVFVRGVLSEAIVQGVSDVHFEPKTDGYKIRFRIDGVLHTYTDRPLDEYSTILNAVKVLGDMKISEHAVPQDGHIELMQEEVDRQIGGNVSDEKKEEQETEAIAQNKKREQHYFDIRVSVFPSVNGESVVMRILNRANALLEMKDLGMDKISLERFHEMLLTAYGMLLITGPTGSGKTTTLYSVLSELRSDEKNIITLEDPIEFHLDWLRQCEIREERGFTFEAAMASVLRQDPDILMVGEIRDSRTAEYAIRSALVGRIVGSTIHANTTIGTIARLLELGIPRGILAHTLNGIIAQRLVRKVCEHCKEEYTPSKQHLAYFGLSNTKAVFYKGKGCEKCNYTGYKGRTGLFSVMIFDDEIRGLLFDKVPLKKIQDYAIGSGMKTLKADAAEKILAGITTAEEAVRVV